MSIVGTGFVSFYDVRAELVAVTDSAVLVSREGLLERYVFGSGFEVIPEEGLGADDVDLPIRTRRRSPSSCPSPVTRSGSRTPSSRRFCGFRGRTA